MRRMTWIALVVGFFGVTQSAWAQPGVLYSEPVVGPAGSTASAKVRIAPTFDVGGWGYAVCPDLSVAGIVNAVSTPDVETINNGLPPDFQSIDFTSLSARHSVVICFSACAVLPVGSDTAILDVQYAMTGSDGDLGDVCICEGTPPLPITLIDAAGNTITVPSTCSQITVGPCSSLVPNRRVESFDIQSRAGQPSRFDLNVEWSVETVTAFSSLDTRVIFEVDGVLVGSEVVQLEVGLLNCCDVLCSSACGAWIVNGSAATGACLPSPVQSGCACQILQGATLQDVLVPEGALVTARLEAVPGSVPETIILDDEVTRLAPFFNREVVRVAWLPVAGTPSTYNAWVFTKITASEVDAEVDFGFVVSVDPSAGGAGGMTEVDIKIPGGVDPCLLEACGTSCAIPNSGNVANGNCAVKPLCATCVAANKHELGLLSASPGEPIEVMLQPNFDALAEAMPADDMIVVIFDGPIAAPNRRLIPSLSSASVSGSSSVDLVLGWKAETGARALENLSVQFVVNVNGTEVGTFESKEVFGQGSVCADAATCDESGDAWEIDGAVVTAQCRQSVVQQVCVASLNLSETLVGIPAVPGDVITVELVPGIDAMPELFADLDVITLTVPPATEQFVRGDVDGSGLIDLGDAVLVLSALFSGGSLTCRDAADFGDDGAVNIADGISLLSFLFQSAAAPAAPFPDCGVDPSLDSLGCDVFPGCP